MTLRQREVLEATQVQFLVPPLPSIFLATATQVLTKDLLIAFINRLLSTLHHNSLPTEIPEPGCWGLEDNEKGSMNLDNWDPRKTNLNIYKVVALPSPSDPTTLTPIYPQWAVLGGGSLQTSDVKSIQLPSQEVFEVRGSHLLIVVYYQLRVRISNRRSRIEEKEHRLLIPADLKVMDLVKAFRAIFYTSRLYEVLNPSSNLQATDTRTVKELGWRHGTELKLEM